MIEFFISSFEKYFLSDIFAQIFLFSSTFLLSKKSRAGFFCGGISAIFFMIFSFLAESPANFLGNAIWFFLNLRGFLQWKN